MSILVGNAVVGQSGGPTSAINATLAGVIEGTLSKEGRQAIGTLYGMRNGIDGLLLENLVNLTEIFTEDESRIETLKLTPAAALGSCRRKLQSPESCPETYEKLFGIFKKYDIRYFFYIGGNDSMDTVMKLSRYAKEHSYELRVIGVPKTIDNDLMATDHTPGFGSAAKFVATTVKEMLRDVAVYTVKAVTVVEVMGRDAGWLTAASALPIISGGVGPDLIYLPESAFDMERFIEDVKKRLDEHPAVLVCASEGIRFADGSYVGASGASHSGDGFGHVQLSGVGKVLENVIKERIGCKVRSVELSLPQRCAAHIASGNDINESAAVGSGAVKAAIDGSSAVMMTLMRDSSPEYKISIGCADINSIANEVKKVPDEFINAEGNGITEAGLSYLAPLILGEVRGEYENGLPKHLII